MSAEPKSVSMSEGRGLLTETEREAIAGERSDSYRYKTRAYFRNRLEEVERDVEVLEEHAPELLEDLRDAVCESEPRAPREDSVMPQQMSADPSPVEQTRPAEPASTRRDGVESEATEPATLEELIETIDVPGSGEKEQERREAVRAAIDYLQEKGGAEPSDLKAHVYPDYPARYVDGKDPANSWWKNCVYKAFDQIAEADDRLKRADQSGQWRYTGGESE